MTNKIMSADFATCERNGVDQGMHNVRILYLQMSLFWKRALHIAKNYPNFSRSATKRCEMECIMECIRYASLKRTYPGNEPHTL